MTGERRSTMENRTGFPLAEALLVIAAMALVGMAVSGLRETGRCSLDVQAGESARQDHLRSCMQRLADTPVGELSDGSETVEVMYGTCTNSVMIAWSVSPVDLDGDDVPEPEARQVVAFSGNRSLAVILVDQQGGAAAP